VNRRGGLWVEAVGRAEDCPPLRSEDAAIVIDVLRATSAMAAALACGVRRIRPVADVEAARRAAAEAPTRLLVGERANERPPGFHRGNSPLEWTPADRDREAVWTTTNGTRALERANGAGWLAAAALVNRARAARWAEALPAARLVLVPAGEKGQPSEEDWLCAGAVAAALAAPRLGREARKAKAAFEAAGADLVGALRNTRHGQALARLGMEADVLWSARLDVIAVVPVRESREPLWLRPG